MNTLLKNIFLFMLFFSLIPSFSFGYSGTKHGQSVAPIMQDISYERDLTFGKINEKRSAVGLPSLSPNEALSNAAQSHANYIAYNYLASHYEEKGRKGFTGRTPVDRAISSGYKTLQVSENLSARSLNAESSIDGLFSAIYHRFGFLNMDVDEIGVGITQEVQRGENSAFVYVMGNSHLNRLCSGESSAGLSSYVKGGCVDKEFKIDKDVFDKALLYNRARSPKIIKYPYSGETGVSPVFYVEMPHPLPGYKVSGFPISIQFNEYYFKKIEVLDFSLLDSNGEIVPVIPMSAENDPNRKFTKFQFAIFPKERLDFGSYYLARFAYRDEKGKHEIQWNFHTKSPQGKIITVTERDSKVPLRKGAVTVIYLKPIDPSDIIERVKYSQGIKVRLIDNNTIEVIAGPNAPKHSYMNAGNRRIDFIIN